MSEPATKDEILAALEELVRTGSEYWGSFEPEVFVTPIGDAWSPAENVRHLSKSTRPVVKALRLPRIVPLVMFGRASSPSRSLSEVVDAYRTALAGGMTAGRFSPSAQPQVADPAAHKRDVIATWTGVVRDLSRVVEGWPERALDRYRLPHPAIGKLTVREMLFFTLYHHEHHAATVKRRMDESTH